MSDNAISNPSQPPKPVRKRDGPRIRPYSTTRPRHSNTKKREVLVWLANTKIPLRESIAVAFKLAKPSRELPADDLEPLEPGFRRPSLAEAAAFFKIPSSTISGWWTKRDKILAGKWACQCVK
ncbi:hypothetical protein GGR54DRAFT_347551 [Hypoxylon sp. NC1633]|nr:hypothetical protein GGR54DRAFT_347551 [Hypoxylon sp. NC1633]